MSDERFIKEGIRRAQAIGKKHGFKANQTVCHPSDKYAYAFKSGDSKEAKVLMPAKVSPTGKRIVKKFLIAELFDPGIALEEAKKAKAKFIASKLPKNWDVICI